MRSRRTAGAIGIAALLTYAMTVPATATAAAPAMVTRAQFIYEFDRADNIQPVYPQTPDFTDVSSSSPYYGYIEAAYQAGIISGVRTGVFSPNGSITREEIAKIEVLALGDGPQAQALQSQPTIFTDNGATAAWARGYINEAVKLGLISGYPNGAFRATAAITTADTPHFIQKYSTIAGTQGTWTLSVTPSASNVAVGQQVVLSSVVKNAQGTALSGAQVTYTVNSTQALLSGNVFVASSPGNYTITASYQGGVATGSVQIAVFGTPSALKINAPTTIPANGYSQSTVTVDVLDQNGNVVANDNTDQVSLTATGNAVSSISPGTVAAVNGIATFTLTSGLVPGATSTLTALDPSISGSGDMTTATLTSALQSASSLSVTAPQYVSANNAGTPATVKIQVLDQTGQPMLYGTYGFTVSISGPATFAGGSTSPISLAYSGDGQGGSSAPYATVTIDDIQGETGAITITASAANLSSGTGVTTAVIAGVPSGIGITPPNTTSFSQDNAATGISYGISAIDAHGYPVSDAIPVLITVKNASGGLATNIWVDGHAQTTSANGYLDNAAMANETFVLTEVGAGESIGSYTVQVTSPTGLLSSSSVSSFQITAGAVTGITATLNGNFVSALNPETTLTVQLVDVHGNPVSQSGIPVTLTSDIGNAYPVTIADPTGYTNANGQFVSTLQVPPYVGHTFTVDVSATINGAPKTPAIEPSFSVQDTVATSMGVTFDDVSPGPDSDGTYTSSSYVASSSDQVSLTFKALDQYQNPVSTNDTVTVSFSGAGSLTGPTYAGGGAVSVDSSTGVWTVQLTGGQATVNAEAFAAGSLLVSAQDTSVQGGPTGTTSVLIQPGNVTGFDFFSAAGVNLSTPAGSGGAGLAVQANTPVEIYLKPVDAQGNPTIQTQAATAVLSDGGHGGEFRPNYPYNSNTTDYPVTAGMAEASFWYVNSLANTYYLSAVYQQLPATLALSTSLPTNVTAGVPQEITLTATDQYSDPLNGTFPVEITAPTSGPSLLAASPNGKTTVAGTGDPSGTITGGVPLNASGAGVISLTFTNGQADLYVAPIDAQSNASFNLQVDGTTNVLSSGNVTVAGAIPAAIASATAPTGSTVVGTAYDYQLSTVDAYGNISQGSFDPSVSLTIGGLQPSLNGSEPSVYGTAATTTTGSNPVTTAVIPAGTATGDLGAINFVNGKANLPVTFTSTATQTLTFKLSTTGATTVTANASESPGPDTVAYAIVVAPTGSAPTNTVNLATPPYTGGPWTLATVEGSTYGAQTGTLASGSTYNGVIQLVDQYGNTITSGSEASAQITLTLAPGTNSGSTLELSGNTTGLTETLTLANGAAAFTYNALSSSGTGPWTDSLTVSEPPGGTGDLILTLKY